MARGLAGQPESLGLSPASLSMSRKTFPFGSEAGKLAFKGARSAIAHWTTVFAAGSLPTRLTTQQPRVAQQLVYD